MNKESILKKQISELKNQRIEAEKMIKGCNESIDYKYNEMAKLYQNHFDNKKSKDLILYECFPSFETLNLYACRISDKHPMNEYGIFNILELAEIIKLLYQHQRGEEFHILTIGRNYENGIPVYQDQSFNLIPQLFFVIGNKDSIEPYKDYNGKFINEDMVFDFECSKQKQNITAINTDACSPRNKGLDIECLCDTILDVNNRINYYDYIRDSYESCSFSVQKNIFAQYLRTNFYRYKGVKDVLEFKLNVNDTFISKVLISICIYKKNNNITELSKDDYDYIFNTIFGESIDIYKEIERDIPKSLKYIPNSRENYDKKRI
jgi:hypothetical protein